MQAEKEAACEAAVPFVNMDACDLSFAMAALLPEDDPEYLREKHKHEMRRATHAPCKTTPCKVLQRTMIANRLTSGTQTRCITRRDEASEWIAAGGEREAPALGLGV